MSTSSQNHKKTYSRRIDSLQKRDSALSRDDSRSLRRRPITHHDAYLHALRVAYLAYLLQPRAKKSVPAPKVQRTSTSVQDLMKDFSLIRDSKSTKFPHGFMADLEYRMTGVMLAREKRPEYHDAAVKRTVAAALNAFLEGGFKKRMEKERRVEDLVLIFYSRATAELQKGKAPDDDSWKLMVDRHVALFVRLMLLILRESKEGKDKTELITRLASLETKLLAHDDDLTAQSNGAGSMIEVVIPLSYKVEDMPLVQVVGRIFNNSANQLQSDIDMHRSAWTEKAALQDLKTYQTLLNLDSKKTLRSDDFDVEEGYEQWKKHEAPELSQMILAIVHANPELAKTTNIHHHPQPSNPASISTFASSYSEASRKIFEQSDGSSYVFDQPATMSPVSPETSRQSSVEDEHTFTFIPEDPRGVYRFVLSQALSHDLRDENLHPLGGSAGSSTLLSKQSTELLTELCLRWRLPYVSRMVLFLDVVREKFLDREVSLETLSTAFEFVKEPLPDNRKDSHHLSSLLTDRSKWTLTDFALNQQVLTTLHDALLRELYEVVLKVYEPKPPTVGVILYVLDHHIYSDTSFPKTDEDLEAFKVQLRAGLKTAAQQIYNVYMDKHLPQDPSTWEFYNVIQLGQAILTLAEKIQKRYRKNPEIMGANPLTILVDAILPTFAEDARDIVARILHLAKERKEEVPVEDGFELYKELVRIRNVHLEALPGVEFGFRIEELLAAFVWRWINLTDSQMLSWVEGAVKQDSFVVRSAPGEIPSEDERHSVSIIDIFQSFNQTIDKIVQLNWDNDLHYAKFMTALAKVVGVGVARYCELVEQKFAKEMDRFTPEQDPMVSQTRQERWMQLAKDAWNTKEKIEPFQFFPESFIKLNNIEFAMRNLDRLEKEVNVDACVDVIERNAPPLTTRQRKITNYVFTIKIVEAEDLKACDINGLSDPYVVLGDEYQKRLAKTRIIHANLNPRWDESVDITATGPLNVIATVWDWDSLGEHDCVGRTSIKLDPSHFSDFMPREYWLDLDTQGRLLLRVNMEGERDDIQFYFGKAFRTLKRTERDMTRTITDKLSAYINYCLSRRSLKSLLSNGISIATVSSYFNRNRPQQTNTGPTEVEISDALKPLFTYFDDNFAIMNQTLTHPAMMMVMTRIWKEVLATIESLVVPPLSDKPSQQRPLTQRELDIVFKWLDSLYSFFHAVDEETGEANGVPVDVLRSPKYFEIKTLNFFYFEPTDSLIRESERMASVSSSQANKNRLSAPAGFSSAALGGSAGLMGAPGRRAKSIMLSRNLGTMRKAKEDKRKEAQAEPNDDIILRILRMRPEAQRYLRDRSRQKERLAAAAAAEAIVRQSILAGGGRMTGNLPRR